jgi:3'-5' exonuclease
VAPSSGPHWPPVDPITREWYCHGGEVERYFREGKIKEIADYCETDVIGTYQVWQRYELFRGTLSQNAFEASQQNLADFVNARSGMCE